MTRRRAAVLTCGIAGLLLAAPALPAAGAGETTVMIHGRMFHPDPVDVSVGDTVTWSNASEEDHNVRGGPVNSPVLHPGNTFSFRFTNKGTVKYVCDLHPTMKGTVKVE